MRDYGKLAKNYIYPTKPNFSSREQDELKDQSILEIELFRSTPGLMPKATFDEVRVVVNTSRNPCRLFVRMDDDHWSGTLGYDGVIILPSGVSSEWEWLEVCECAILTISRSTILDKNKMYSIRHTSQSILEQFRYFESRTITDLANELIVMCQTDSAYRSACFETMSKALIVMLLRKSERTNCNCPISNKTNPDSTFITNLKTDTLPWSIENCPFKLPDQVTSGSLCKLIEAFLAGNFQSRISTGDMAKAAGKSLAHFSREFKSETGITPYKFLVNYRVKRAIALLNRGNTSLSQISMSCGFVDQSNFSKCFKRVTGFTPKSFAKNISK